MPQDLQQCGFWVHVFRECTFGGRLTPLGPGDGAAIDDVNSLIVGPNASVHFIDRRGKKVLTLSARKVVPDLSSLPLIESVSHLRVLEDR